MTAFDAFECACCGGTGKHTGRSLCGGCYDWHAKAGTLHAYPPLHTWLQTLARIEEYAALRRAGHGIRTAAARVGVSRRSGQRYEQRLRARQAAAS